MNQLIHTAFLYLEWENATSSGGQKARRAPLTIFIDLAIY